MLILSLVSQIIPINLQLLGGVGQGNLYIRVAIFPWHICVTQIGKSLELILSRITTAAAFNIRSIEIIIAGRFSLKLRALQGALESTN
jgi:hypothetical protein